MNELYKKLKKYDLKDAIAIEESDRQFIALKYLWENIKNKKDNNMTWIYLSLIIFNSIICYQLTWKWEEYWEEFSNYFINILKNNIEDTIIENLVNFIKNSKNNKRFIETKIKRLNKIEIFYNNFSKNTKYYYENMETLANDLAKIMNQKNSAKTIVFAVKMFSYWARNVYNKLEYFPKKIPIPIDSRLIKLYKKYELNKNIDIKKYYKNLSKKLNIPELHLDAIIWVNYNKLID